MSESDDQHGSMSAESSTQERQPPASQTEDTNSTLNLHIDVEVDLRKALFAGILSALVALIGSFSVGRLSGADGLVLLQGMIPTIRFLASSVMTASAAILALMLTLLGLSHRTRRKIKPSHYRRINQIALIDTVAFVLATLFLLFINVPLQETDGIPAEWFNTIYYIVIVTSSVLGGLLITVMLMLYGAVRDIIYVVGIGVQDYPIVSEENGVDAD